MAVVIGLADWSKGTADIAAINTTGGLNDYSRNINTNPVANRSGKTRIHGAYCYRAGIDRRLLADMARGLWS